MAGAKASTASWFPLRSSEVSAVCNASASATAAPPSAPSALYARLRLVSVAFSPSAAATALPPAASSPFLRRLSSVRIPCVTAQGAACCRHLPMRLSWSPQHP
eukprot:scaffold72591_cov56-Phaeocystis_antarctica.AAC.2